MHSHHSHSGQFCKHASGTLEEVVLEAISQGFATYGLTEHVPRYRNQDLYPEEEGLSIADLTAQFESFLAEAHHLKTKYAEQITLLVGLETEYISPLDIKHLSTLLEKHDPKKIEYLVCSVHHVNGIPIDFDKTTYERCLASFPSDETTSSFLCAYLDAQYTLLTTFKPAVVGHFDLCRLYNPTLHFSEYPQALEKAERNIKFAIDYGALFEVNAAAFRKGWNNAYPGEDILGVILKYGGRLCLSDDSHGPHAVGLNYHCLYAYLRSQNVKELWYLAPIPDAACIGSFSTVAATRVEGLWWESAFWQKRSV